MRCLGLFGLVERRPSEELVKQLRLSFINGPPPVKVMASRALIDLVTWHGPQELDRAIGLDPPLSSDKSSFTLVDLSNGNDDLSIGLLDLLYSALESDECFKSCEVNDHETVHSIVGEGFAKILLLSQNYPSIPTSLHPSLLGKLVCLYFCSEAKELERYCLLLFLSFLVCLLLRCTIKFCSLRRFKQCLSVFFDHYAALSGTHKASISCLRTPALFCISLSCPKPLVSTFKLLPDFGCFFFICFAQTQKYVSRAFIPVMRSIWPGVYGNAGGSSVVVSKLRKRAINISRFMLQMLQTPLYSKEVEDAEHSENSPGTLPTTGQSTLDIDSGEEGLAIRIGAEVISSCCLMIASSY